MDLWRYSLLRWRHRSRVETLWTKLKKILQNIDLYYLTNNFSEASVDNLNICKSLSDADLGKLGVVTIRDLIRFREELRRGNY